MEQRTNTCILVESLNSKKAVNMACKTCISRLMNKLQKQMRSQYRKYQGHKSIPCSGNSFSMVQFKMPANMTAKTLAYMYVICIYHLIGELLASKLKSYISRLFPLRKIDTLTLKLSESILHLSLYLTYELRYTYICPIWPSSWKLHI